MDITHAGVTVADLEQSLWFYRDLLGMEVVRQYISKSDVARVMWNAPGLEQLESAMVRLPGSAQEVQLTQATGDFGTRRSHLDVNPWDLGAARLTLAIDDLDRVVVRLADNGFHPRAGEIVVATQGASSGLRGAMYTDPNGLFVVLLQPPAGGEIDDTVRAGITVGDLKRSVWFYRDALGMEVLHRRDGDLEFVRALWAAPALTSSASAILRMPGFSQHLEITEVGGVPQDKLVGHQWDVGFSHVCFPHPDLTGTLRGLGRQRDPTESGGKGDDRRVGHRFPRPRLRRLRSRVAATAMRERGLPTGDHMQSSNSGRQSTDDYRRGGADLIDIGNPQPSYRTMRATCPVTTSGGIADLTKDTDIQAALRNPEVFASKGRGNVGNTRPRIPVDIDPPEHHRYRRILDPLFSPREMARFEPHFTDLTNRLIDGFADRGTCDFAAEFAEPLPSLMFLQLLGSPRSRTFRCSSASKMP